MFVWRRPGELSKPIERSIWIPPGAWRDAWTGETIPGPKTMSIPSLLWHLPMFVREGGVVFSVPQMQHTAEKPWTTLVVDAFVPRETGSTTRTLYEDDGVSPDYQQGAFWRTPVTLERADDVARVRIGKAEGIFDGGFRERSWVVRLHLPRGTTANQVVCDGQVLALSDAADAVARLIQPRADASVMPFPGAGGAPGPRSGPVAEVKLPPVKLDRGTMIEIRLAP
jgi:hypothetical protein